MNRVAIAFFTKDRTELSRRSIGPLLQPGEFDLFWVDGSVTEEGKYLPETYKPTVVHRNVRGGPDTAVVCTLTRLLENAYTHIGICENDVLLNKDWFGPTMALFERGEAEGLRVGAVSPRCYQDRILIQRDGYAVVHNLGWGVQIMTREAAALTVQNIRCPWTTENVLLFSQLVGLDMRKWWAFRGAEQWLCPDWRNDAMLAAHGFASLALTPSLVEMIGQNPSLAEQGLQMADGKYELLRDDKVFYRYAGSLETVRIGEFNPTFHQVHRDSQGYLYFTHQLGAIGAEWHGDWRLQWAQGFGPFAWRADSAHDYQPVAGPFAIYKNSVEPNWTIPVLGPCSVIVSGGDIGGKVHVVDEQSGYEIQLDLTPEHQQGAYQLAIPGNVAYRTIRLKALSSGVVFYGLRTQVEQPQYSDSTGFDWNRLPPV